MKKLALLLSVLVSFSLLLAQPKEPQKGTKCVVCGMDVNMMPKFTSQLKLKSGEYLYTESPKHAFQYYLKNRDRISQVWVKDFTTGEWIDATSGYYVPVEEGPMGPDVAPFKSLVEAKRFAKGKRVYRFQDIDAQFLKNLETGHGEGKHMH